MINWCLNSEQDKYQRNFNFEDYVFFEHNIYQINLNNASKIKLKTAQFTVIWGGMNLNIVSIYNVLIIKSSKFYGICNMYSVNMR